jgi:uncharacterized protein (DUF2267 family)
MKSSQNEHHATFSVKERWSFEIAKKLGEPENPDVGYMALISVLHAMRDLLCLDGVFYISRALPECLRGLYFEGYNPQEVPVMLYNKEFLKQYKRRMGPGNIRYLEQFLHGYTSGKPDPDKLLDRIRDKYAPLEPFEPDAALRAVVQVMVSDHNFEQLKQFTSLLPKHDFDLYKM